MPAKIDLTGRQFARLTVIKEIETTKKGTYWLCRCSCGTEKVIAGRNLTNNQTFSCGCLNAELSSQRSRIDLTGQRFGRYTVLEYVGLRQECTYWKVQCDCGSIKEVRGYNLRKGDVVSCGCWKIEKSIERNTTHGLTGTKLYGRIRANRRRELHELHDTEWTIDMEQYLRTVFNQCVLCGMTEKEHQEEFGMSLCVDHLYPLSEGFGLKPGNCTLLCDICNKKKHIKHPDDLPEPVRDRLIQSAELFKLLWDGRKHV